MTDHARMEEQLVAYALGGMEPIERAAFEAEFEAHRPTCERCREMHSEITEVAGRLALAADPVAPPPDLEDRIVALATGEGSAVRRLTPPRRVRQILTGVAAALLLIVGSVGSTLAVTRGADQELRVARLDVPGGGVVALAYEPGDRDAVVVAAGVPMPQPGRVYQLWVRSDGTMLPGTTFLPADGQVVSPTELPSGDFDLVAITHEPAGGSEQPTSDPIAAVEA